MADFNCFICEGKIKYLEKSEKMKCFICKREFKSNTRCENGHYVCDECHSMNAVDFIEKYCSNCEIKDPLEISENLMKHPSVNMHGPEHHYLVPASLITAYLNERGESDIKNKCLEEAKVRASKVPGGVCGLFGSCGAAVGTGIFVSIVTGATPMSEYEKWGNPNLMTSEALKNIYSYGGPRCCKRNVREAIKTAADFSGKVLGTDLKINISPVCHYREFNKECINRRCIYSPERNSF